LGKKLLKEAKKGYTTKRYPDARDIRKAEI
jgi:hypothetical protein